MIDNIIKCPWHGASFDILTGNCDISPSVDSLPKFQIYEENGDLFVNLPKKMQNSVVVPMAKRDPEDKRRFVIIIKNKYVFNPLYL